MQLDSMDLSVYDESNLTSARIWDAGVPEDGRKGLSRGRTLSTVDHFLTTADRAMVVQVPIRGVRTLYSRIGDLFAWIALAGLALEVGVALVRPSRTPAAAC